MKVLIPNSKIFKTILNLDNMHKKKKKKLLNFIKKLIILNKLFNILSKK
jgi:hypothetical protein